MRGSRENKGRFIEEDSRDERERLRKEKKMKKMKKVNLGKMAGSVFDKVKSVFSMENEGNKSNNVKRGRPMIEPETRLNQRQKPIQQRRPFEEPRPMVDPTKSSAPIEKVRDIKRRMDDIKEGNRDRVEPASEDDYYDDNEYYEDDNQYYEDDEYYEDDGYYDDVPARPVKRRVIRDLEYTFDHQSPADLLRRLSSVQIGMLGNLKQMKNKRIIDTIIDNHGLREEYDDIMGPVEDEFYDDDEDYYY
jgi:hypothetical protein